MFIEFNGFYAESNSQLQKRYYFTQNQLNADSFVTECQIEYYGEQLCDGKESDTYLGSVSGWLVSGDQLGYQSYMCDDIDAKLSFVVSAMSEEEGLLEIDPYRSFFYLQELKMEENYDTNKLKLMILRNLAETVLTLYHIYPSLIIVFPEPTCRIKSEREQIKDNFAVIAAKEIMDEKGPSSDQVFLSLDEEQYSYLMGQRKLHESYPEDAIDRKLWNLYQSAGFEEHGNTRVLFYNTAYINHEIDDYEGCE